MRGATEKYDVDKKYDFISIHAPHAGRDKLLIMLKIAYIYFNPRAPCGARLVELWLALH